MRTGYIFYKTEKQFYWGDNTRRISFSNPSMQGFDEYKHLNSVNEIMYLYYLLNIEVKNQYTQKWEKALSCHVSDFPALLDLQQMLALAASKSENEHKGYQIDEIKSNIKGEIKHYQYSLSSSVSEIYDDIYIIEHHIEDWEKDIRSWYTFSVGDRTRIIRFASINPKELLELKTCVDNFIVYALAEHNKQITKYNKIACSLYYHHDGKLYEKGYHVDEYTKNGIFDSEISMVYAPNETYDFTVMTGSLGAEDMSSVHYLNAEIVSVDVNTVILLTDNEHVVVPINRILFISKLSNTEEFIYYNENDVEKDFQKILSDDELEEINISTIDASFNKWGDVLVNRTWMLRPEHAFKKYVDTQEDHANEKEIIRRILKHIKEG